jgi:transcriptional regulator with XRE-family HTH domain
MSAAAATLNQAPHFWEQDSIRTALASQHFGRFLRAYREAHSPVLKQAQVGEWIGLTQGQVSRIEHSATPVTDIGKLARWAEALHVPKQYLWFRASYTPGAHIDPVGPEVDPRVGSEEDDVNRRDLLRLTGIVAATAGTGLTGGLRVITERECAEKLAWELWQRRTSAIHASELPLSVATYLGVIGPDGKMKAGAMRISPEGLIVGDKDNYFSFAQPSLVDFYVGQHVFANITAGHSHLLATAQTSHETDLVLQNLVQRHEPSVGLLARWMRAGQTPVLQVNSAGILAKIGNARLIDSVVSTLKESRDTRQLYLTAVANRVLEIEWDKAALLAADSEAGAGALHLSGDQAARLAKEVRNPRDGAARWCSIALLGQSDAAESDVTRAALQRALQEEACVENLRSIGNALIGNNLFNS